MRRRTGGGWITGRGVAHGFHGTSAASAGRIVSEQRFLPSHSEGLWLGPGVYFHRSFRDAWHRAREKDDAHPAVLVARVKLGICLDLRGSDNALVSTIRAQVLDELRARGKKPPPDDEDRHFLDHETMTRVIAAHKPHMIMADFHFFGGNAIPTSIPGRVEEQLCVVDLSCISEIEICTGGGNK